MARAAKVVRKIHKPKHRRKGNGLISRRRKNNPIRPGMQLGELEVLQRVNTAQGSSGGQKWSCRCSCGVVSSIPQWYLVRKEFPKRHCGAAMHKKQKMAHARERGIWYMMHRRCYNPTHIAYKHYGGANPPIGVCDSWNKDKVGPDAAWENFIKDMGPAPCVKGENYTLDRINPFKWYGWVDDPTKPGHFILNCRWASASEQMNNLKRHWVNPNTLAEQLESEKFDVDVETDTDDEDEEEDDEA